jgi:hypothetical protein
MGWENVHDLCCQITNAVSCGDESGEMALRCQLEELIPRLLKAGNLTKLQEYNLKATLADFGEGDKALARLQEAYNYAQELDLPSALIDSVFSMAEHYYLESNAGELAKWKTRGEKLLVGGLLADDKSERNYWEKRFRGLNLAADGQTSSRV